MVERPLSLGDRDLLVADFLFLDGSRSPKMAFWRCRVHASNCCSIGSWERGDTMRFLRVMGLDYYDYEPFDACLQNDLPHRVLVASVVHSKEMLGDKQRVSTQILPVCLVGGLAYWHFLMYPSLLAAVIADMPLQPAQRPVPMPGGVRGPPPVDRHVHLPRHGRGAAARAILDRGRRGKAPLGCLRLARRLP